MEIKIKDVDFEYQKVNCTTKSVFNDLNVCFNPNKIHGIIGKSGSGKTTLLELIDLLLIPTKGQIKIGNHTFSSCEKLENVNDLRFKIGFVFQLPEEQFFNSTVFDELAFSLRYYNYHLNDINKRISDALKMVGLNDEYLQKNPFHLSNGEKRKVAIAASLIYNPKILLLDEPTLGLDGKSKESLVKLLRLLKNRYHKTIIIATHDTDFLHRVVDCVYVLDNHNIVLSGNKYEVFKNVKELKKYGVKSPKIIEFSDKVLQKKQIKIGYRDEINDLIKDIYRYVK